MKTTNTNANTRRRRASEANRRSRHVLPVAVSTKESPQTTRHTVRTTKNKEQKEGCEVLQPSTFPYKLRDMLEHASSCDSAELQSACFWSPDGTAFVISNTDVVMEELVPMFFKQTKFRSFTRQLNLWGFVRTGKKIWRHNQSLFHRDRPLLMKKIERTALKSSPPSSSSDPLIGTTVVTTAMPVVDSGLDSMNALIIAGGGIPITQQFTSDELLYLANMFEEDENIISSSSTM